MLFASDFEDNRVHIDDTHSNQEYYCPYCGAPLVTKKGDIRQHHFAHKQSHVCSDTWANGGSHGYDLSPWHNEWQSLFPKVNQEVKLCLGETKHRADVLVDRTVIEFQHSIMPVKAFDDRNNFYFNLGYKVIWLFDLSDLYSIGQLTYKPINNGLFFTWKNPKKAFNNYDIQSGCIDLFFQLGSSIVRVTDVSPMGFESFSTTTLMEKNDFLTYVGLCDGTCLPPCRDDLEHNQLYHQFKEQYHISLNKQQERALQAVEGSNLLLAVPGSGKTTVLVARLGYMVLNKNIAPESILAITYINSAANEMRERFSSLFGRNIGRRIDFRTINSLSQLIYTDYCRKTDQRSKTLIEEKERKKLIRNIFKEYHHKYAYENDLQKLSSAIVYIKNMMLAGKQILDIEADYLHLNDMYNAYQSALDKQNQMDFDDQMIFALKILREDGDALHSLQQRYKYICVDEAQDTSRIQHEIIRLLACGNNLFMVGDEDQSIYGFRAAYPKALLNFRYDYPNPYILRMERNYRSTNQIVEKAQTFISQNKGRYEKNMTAARGDGEDVSLISVASREAQYMYLLNVAKTAKTETAFLYRDNESAIVLVDLFLRNNVQFKLRKPEMNFFEVRIVKDIVAFLSLAINNHDARLLDQICNKGILYLEEKQRYWANRNCHEKHISVFDAIDERMQYVAPRYRNRSSRFRDIITEVSKASPVEAISILLESGYGAYLSEKHFDTGKIEILQILAKQESTIEGFLNRLRDLERLLKQGFTSEHENPIILSTIHSSKGLEYDTVYMVDVYKGRFPSLRSNIFCRSKDSADGEQEERRLFYVGITRAKNKLHLFEINERESPYIDELFPEARMLRLQKQEEKQKKFVEEREQMRAEQVRIQRERYLQQQETLKKEREEAAKKAREDQKQRAEMDYMKRYNEVKGKFVQQETPIKDSSGRRWVQCEICHEIKEESEFSYYGGMNQVNLGKCSKCSRNSSL